MERSSTVENRQTLTGYLATLYVRHDTAAAQYRTVLQALDEDRTLRTFTKSLADYHAQCAQDIKTMIDDHPSIPVKPNTKMKEGARDVQPDEMDNDVALLKNYQGREEFLLQYYTEALDDDGIPQEYYEKLQDMSETEQEVVRKIHRTISSGTVEKDMTVL